MPSRQPLLGSLAVQAPSLTPQIVRVSPSTCQDLSLFKGAFVQKHTPRAIRWLILGVRSPEGVQKTR